MIQKLSLSEVDNLRGRADDRFDVFPLHFHFLSLSESALKFLDLFLSGSKKSGRNQKLDADGSRRV